MKVNIGEMIKIHDSDSSGKVQIPIQITDDNNIEIVSETVSIPVNYDTFGIGETFYTTEYDKDGEAIKDDKGDVKRTILDSAYFKDDLANMINKEVFRLVEVVEEKIAKVGKLDISNLSDLVYTKFVIAKPGIPIVITKPIGTGGGI